MGRFDVDRATHARVLRRAAHVITLRGWQRGAAGAGWKRLCDDGPVCALGAIGVALQELLPVPTEPFDLLTPEQKSAGWMLYVYDSVDGSVPGVDALAREIKEDYLGDYVPSAKVYQWSDDVKSAAVVADKMIRAALILEEG